MIVINRARQDHFFLSQNSKKYGFKKGYMQIPKKVPQVALLRTTGGVIAMGVGGMLVYVVQVEQVALLLAWTV